jgi:hypothetical protein
MGVTSVTARIQMCHKKTELLSEKAFLAACMNGHVELVKYIWQLGLIYG